MRFNGLFKIALLTTLVVNLTGCYERRYNRAFHDGSQALAVDFVAEYRRQQEGRLLHDANRCPRFQPVLADITVPGGLQGPVFVQTQTLPVVIRGTVMHPDCLDRVRQ